MVQLKSVRLCLLKVPIFSCLYLLGLIKTPGQGIGSPRHVQSFKARYLLKSAAGFSIKNEISEKFHNPFKFQLYCAHVCSNGLF